jgi:ABC-type Fe3+-hydroxamate transport system substrate-binding protein
MGTASIFFLIVSFLMSTQAFAFSRIVTLAPVLSEWTAEVLGQATAEKIILGVSEYSYYPAYLKKIPTVGAYVKLNIEAIARLKPDLVIGSEEYTRPEQIEQLKRLKLPLVMLAKENFLEMATWIKQLGEVLHEPKNAEALATRWTAEVKALTVYQKKSISFFLEVQHQPLVTVGGSSFLNDAFTVVGYKNIFRSLPQAYPKVSKEAVLKENPEKILIMDLTGNPKDFANAKLDWEKYGKHPAIIPGDDFARCSFSLLKGLKNL